LCYEKKEENYFSGKIHAILPPKIGVGVWNRNFGDSPRTKRFEKPFWAAVAKVAA